MKKFNSFLLRNQHLLMFIFIVLIATLVSTDMYARMGGAGGGSRSSGGSGGGDGIGALIFYLFMMLPFPLNWIVITSYSIHYTKLYE